MLCNMQSHTSDGGCLLPALCQTHGHNVGAGEGEGTFKEHEGTGMGEGEGAKDVSDKIENEDQMQGAQQKGQQQPEVSSASDISHSAFGSCMGSHACLSLCYTDHVQKSL